MSFSYHLIFVSHPPSYTEESNNISLIDGPETDSRIATYHLPSEDGMPTLL